jgi:uncharacterized repeat protein (TIGR03803 family)
MFAFQINNNKQMNKPFTSFLLGALLLLSLTAHAQFTKLADLYTTGNGRNPAYNPLISDGTYLYGTTSYGGVYDKGVVFKIKPDGTEYTLLHEFNTSDGAAPEGSLLFDGTWLFGTCTGGGNNNCGTVYKIMPDGSNFTTLHYFSNAFGKNPQAGLVSDGTWLYGTTFIGGANNWGAVYKVKIDGTSAVSLYSLNYSTVGGYPGGQLYFDGTWLYGTTHNGGTGVGFGGTLFKMSTDGSTFTVLHHFAAASGGASWGDLTSVGGYLYGTTSSGGTNNTGTIFKIMPDGSNFSNIYNLPANAPGSRNALCYDGTYFYYASSDATLSDEGMIFKILPDGTGFTSLYEFNGNPDGDKPSGLFLQGNTLYSSTLSGGTSDLGTIIKINTDGTGYSKLFNFNGTNSYYPTSYGALTTDGTWFYGTVAQGPATGGTGGLLFKIKPDGEFAAIHRFETTTEREPQSSLYFDGTYLYGTTYNSGSNNSGTIYKVMPDGSNYTILRAFTSADQNGQYLYCTPVSDGTFLYGVTYAGGLNGKGVIFKIKPDGTGFAKLFDFDGTITGQNPRGSLYYDGTYLYGTTSQGGLNSEGTIFKIKPDGTDFTKLLDCSSATIGSNPSSTLISDGTYLYGTMATGYPSGDGSVFRMLPDGTGFSVLHPFTTQLGGRRINGDVLLKDNYLYGMTETGGVNDEGTIFRLKTDGSVFEKLHDFDEPDGRYPMSSLSTDGTYLYGTTRVGGVSGYGTVFKLCPQVTNTQTLTICPGESVTVGSSTYNATGVFTDVLQAVTGCDSIVTTNLTVRSANTFIQSPTLCAGESITVGANTYNTSATYIDVLTSLVTGCDSTVTTNLTVRPPNTFTQSPVICQGESVTVGNNTYTTSNTYIDVLTSVVTGCDSTVTTNLTVELCTGINNHEVSDIIIYPNPVKFEITVSGYNAVYLKLCNKLGQTVAEASKSNKLYVGNLSQGLYVLQVFDANGQQIKTEKVIVAK